MRLDRLSEATLLTGEALLATGGTALDTITACAGPVGIAVDATRRRIWVADSGVDRVVALAPDGTVQFVITGQAEAREIALDEATGEAWVTLAAAGAVARLSPAGVEILRTGGLGGPWGIALDDLSARTPPLPRNEAGAGLVGLSFALTSRANRS